MKDIKSFGQWVRYHRKKKRISQKSLAAKAGLSPGAINHLEKGRFRQREIMALEKALTLIKELPISDDERAKLRPLAIQGDKDKTVVAKFPEIGKRLSGIMDGHGISVNDLSIELHVSMALVSQWRTGKQAPSQENAKKLVPYFRKRNVTTEDINLFKRAYAKDQLRAKLKISDPSSDQQKDIVKGIFG